MTALIKSVSEINNFILKSKRPIGLIPTMGALHAGHISLIKSSLYECATTVVYIFVNPLQFAPHEDFKTYPRNCEKDFAICEELNAHGVFIPEAKEIYSEVEINKINVIQPPEELRTILCGKARPHFFGGVATVLDRFFKILKPDNVYFGEKDYQQTQVVKWLINKNKMPINLVVCPTIRESNGLAFSSRNNYLTQEQKEMASNLYKALKLAKENIKSGMFTVNKSILESLVFLSQISGIKVEYFEARDKEDLSVVSDERRDGFYFFIAANIAGVRLIDNIEV